jgi:glutathionylspermidine synthase
VIRFDFHLTADGWRISEANTDVPGGFIEASGFSALIAGYYPAFQPVGDPAGAYIDAIIARTGPGARIALVHATAYSDDNQVMRYLAQRLEKRGATPVLLSPAHISWRNGRAFISADWARGPVHGLVRFFPAEWLANLGRRDVWQPFFSGAMTPASNPATALLTQSKRLPLIWDALRTDFSTWRRVLAETREHRAVPWRSGEAWVLKPALGRVGEGVGLRGVTTPVEWRRIRRDLFWHPGSWVAQRRFAASPVMTDDGLRYACIGVFTVDEQAVGAYGRLASVPLIDSRAQDVAILIEREQ